MDIYQDVTDRIIEALEAGTVPWLRPWRDGKSGSIAEPHNAVTGRPYSGINALLLGLAPYPSLGWLTYKQALELGGNVRKGEKGTHIIFWKFEKGRDKDTGEVKVIPFARGYTVFNTDQCENLNPAKIKAPVPAVPSAGSIAALAAMRGARTVFGGNRAFYTMQADFIAMPSADAFRTKADEESTYAHELTHWTGHPSRCNRQFGKRFGDSAYAFEELVAEIGSAFLCAQEGIKLSGLQHPDYLANWLAVLKGDKRAIFTASSQAKKAVQFLRGEATEEVQAAA